MTVKCKICRLEWKDANEIKESTKAEHLKHLGHDLEAS